MNIDALRELLQDDAAIRRALDQARGLVELAREESLRLSEITRREIESDSIRMRVLPPSVSKSGEISPRPRL